MDIIGTNVISGIAWIRPRCDIPECLNLVQVYPDGLPNVFDPTHADGFPASLADNVQRAEDLGIVAIPRWEFIHVNDRVLPQVVHPPSNSPTGLDMSFM